MKILHIILTVIAFYLASCVKHVDEPTEPHNDESAFRTVFVCDQWGDANGNIIRRRGSALDTTYVNPVTPGGSGPTEIKPSVKVCMKGHFELTPR